MNPTFRELRKTVYALTRRYGQGITLCRTHDDFTDFTTGAQTSILVTLFIKRAVNMPAKDARNFQRTIVDTARIQDFAYGNMFDLRTRGVLLDRRLIPSNFPVDLNMHLVFPVDAAGNFTPASKRWEVKGIEEYEEAECLMLTVVQLDGALLEPNMPGPTSQRWVVKIVDYFLANSDDGITFSNRGAPGPVTFTLPPSPFPGQVETFVIQSPFQVTVKGNVGQAVQDDSLVGTQASSSNPADSITFEWDGSSTWVAVGGTGSFTIS